MRKPLLSETILDVRNLNDADLFTSAGTYLSEAGVDMSLEAAGNPMETEKDDMTIFTTEQLVARWEAHNEITNLVGRWAFHELLRDADALEGYWCSEALTPTLGFGHGYYRGRAAVAAYLRSRKDLELRRAKAAKALHADELGDRSPESLRGVGALHALNFTTPVLEIAADGETAKGLWYIISGEADHYTGRGPAARNRWGRVGIDFIKEAGSWKLWHAVFAFDFDAPMGASWTRESPADEPPEACAEIAAFEFPRPTAEREVYPPYSADRDPARFPDIPRPYGTFAETFSYGAE
jgi:hypothetical protein